MKYVHKSNETRANRIIDSYLRFARKQTWYSASEIYKGFWGSRGKHHLIDNILLPEQSNLCCYCQKRLTDHSDVNVTIEHIIRQGIANEMSMLPFFKPEYLGLNIHNVCHTDNYVNNNIRPKPYPHKVAYHNFAIACQRCNCARGHQDIDIPFLYPSIENDVIYDRYCGKAKWVSDPFVPQLTDKYTLDKLELNTPLLKAIRTVWMVGKDHPVSNFSTPDTIKTLDQRRDLIYRSMGQAAIQNRWFSLDDQDAFLSLLTDELWDEVLKFDYFGKI